MLHYIHKLGKGNLEKVIGVFVLSALGVLIFTLLLIGARKNIFGTGHTIHTAFNRGYGLKKGSPVDLAGVEAGNIISLHFNEQNKVDVTLAIQKKYKNKIRTDSVVKIVSHGLMGNMGLSISIGSPAKPIVGDGGYIQGLDISELNGTPESTNPVFAKAGEALNNVIYLTNRLNKPLAKINLILERLDGISERILEGEGTLGTFINDNTLYTNLVKMIDSSQRLFSNIDIASRNIQIASKRFPELIDKVDASMIALHKSAEKLPSVLTNGQELISNLKSSNDEFKNLVKSGSAQITNIEEILKDLKVASANLPGIVRSTQENVDEITRIIEGSEKNWIIKGFIERKKKDEPIIIDMRDGHYQKTAGE